MQRTHLLQHFEALAETPEAPAKLHELILQLAIRGQLLPQNSEDASSTKMADATRKQADVDLPTITSDDTPFDLPKGWAWLRIGEAMRLINGRAFKPTDWSQEGLPIVRIQNLNNPDAPFNYCNFEVDEKVIIRTGDFLISWSGTPGTSFGAFIWNRGKAVLNQHIFRAELVGDAYTKEFLRLAVNGRLEEMIAKAHGAVGLQHITKGKLEMLVLPLPPLAEQRRIVAKVDELMALCDELAARQQARHAARAQLQHSALHHLLAAREPQTFAAAWQRVRDHFHLLHDTPDAIPQLRQALLQLAVQGRLVPQNPKDEPAEKLLRDIAIKTKQSSGGNGSDDTVWAESPHLPPFELPASWRWARFDKIATIASSLVQPAKFASLPHVAPDNIEKGTGRLLPYRTVKEDDVRSANHRFFPGQIVYSKIRPNLSKAVVVDFEGLCSADMYPINPHINADYLLRYILSQTFLDMAVRNDTRVAMPKINQEELNRVLVAVPPLAEQKRIVARVEALLRWCDTLEAQLHQTRTLGAHLLDATLHHALAAETTIAA